MAWPLGKLWLRTSTSRKAACGRSRANTSFRLSERKRAADIATASGSMARRRWMSRKPTAMNRVIAQHPGVAEAGQLGGGAEQPGRADGLRRIAADPQSRQDRAVEIVALADLVQDADEAENAQGGDQQGRGRGELGARQRKSAAAQGKQPGRLHRQPTERPAGSSAEGYMANLLAGPAWLSAP